MKRFFRKAFGITLAISLLAVGTACAGEEIVQTSPDDTAVVEVSETATTAGLQEADVKALQEYLISLGFLTGEADGIFGQMTQDALTGFQAAYGIEVTGEADTQTLDMLRMLVDSIATAPEENAEYALTMFRSINILRYEDGKYYVEPNTVSDKVFESAEAALKAVIESVKASTEIPANDTKVLVKVNKDVVSGVIFENDLITDGEDNFLDIALLKKLAARNDGLTIADADGNEISIDAEGVITSNTGNILTKVVDYDDMTAIIRDTESKSVEEALAVEMVATENAEVATDASEKEIADADTFRNIVLNRTADNTYEVEANTVSENTLNEFRKAYTAIRYAYLHSDKVPVADMEKRIKVDTNNLPNEITVNDLTEDEEGNPYITVREVQWIADRAGTEIILTDSEGNNITIDNLGNVNSDTGNIVSQEVNIETGEATTEFETKPVEEATQQETRPADPVAEIPTEVEVPTTVAPEPETERPTQPSGNTEQPTTSGQVEQPTQPQHQHSWVEVTSTVHHDATYKTVHHDATTHIVHHPAVTHEEYTYEERPIYESHTIEVCGNCGLEFDYATGSYAENLAFEDHLWECQGGASSYNYQKDVYVGSEQVCTGSYTVTDSEAWDETVVDSNAWDEQVVDQPAWDEVVVTGYKCSTCGATK